MNLHPFDECAKTARERMDQGFMVYQQFSCAHCGKKWTMDNPNVFYMFGDCQDCGKRTDIVKDGCNYMVTMGV